MLSKKDSIRWGILGCGKVVEEKSGPAFNRIPNSSLYSVMRRDKEKAMASAKKLGAVKWYDNADELINDDMVDAIYIATPPGVHYEHAMACSRAKKPVYIEKPIARSYNEALEIVEAFESTNTPFFVGHYRRALPRFIEVKKVIESGEIGRVCEVDFREMRKYSPTETSQTWLYNAEISGGGKFFDVAPHSIDLMIFLFGDFESIHGFASNNNKDYLVEDIVVAVFKTKFGVLGTINFNSISNEKSDQMMIYGTDGHIILNVHGNEPIKVDGINGKREIDIKNPACIEEPMIETVVNELLGFETCPCTGRDSLSTAKAIDDVLAEYYGGRNDRFWERTDEWGR